MHTKCGPGAWVVIQLIDSDFEDLLILAISRYPSYWLGVTSIIRLFVKFTDPSTSTACAFESKKSEQTKRNEKKHQFGSKSTDTRKHRKSAKLPWRRNIELSFWSLSFCLFVFLSFCLFVFLPFCLFVVLSFCLFDFLSFCPNIPLIKCLKGLKSRKSLFVSEF